MAKPIRLNIVQKFVFFLLGTSLLPLAFTGLISYQVSRQVVRDEVATYSAEILNHQKETIELELEQVETLILNLVSHEDLTTWLDDSGAQGSVYDELSTQASIGYILNGYTNLKGLVSIDLITFNGRHYHVGDTLDTEPIPKQQIDSIYYRLALSTKNILWPGIEENINVQSKTRLVLPAYHLVSRIDPQTMRRSPVALLVVSYDPARFYNQLMASHVGDDAHQIIIDAQRRIIFHPDQRLIGQALSEDFVRGLGEPGSGQNMVVNGHEMLVNHTHLDFNDWQIISLVPQEALSAKTDIIRTVTLLCLLISLVTIITFALVYSRQIVVPLRLITQRFLQIQAGVQGWETPLPERGRDEVGDLVRWFNIFLESLATRQRSEQALKESEERYALAVRGANDGLWDWNLQNNTIYYSPRWKSMLGYEESEVSAHPEEWIKRVHSEDLPLLQSRIESHLAGQTSHFECEHRLLHKDGFYLWVLARGLAVHLPGGQSYRMAGSHTEISARKWAEEQLRHDAFYDVLTGLPNRALFLDRLGQAILRSIRYEDHYFAVLFMDIDHFKLINDSLGHATGDELLRCVATRLRACIRANDTIARLGGDEFVILLDPADGIDDASAVAARILDSLAEPVDLMGREVVTTASIGILMSDADYKSPEAYLRDADTAMYNAKARGKAQYAIFTSSMREKILNRLSLELDLRQAIEQHEFELYYQPILRLDTCQVTGFEALLRWHHPTLGEIPPADFIPIAEEIGLIRPIGCWILEEACRQLASWQARFAWGSAFHMNVNISRQQLLDKDLAEYVAQILEKHRLQPGTLNLEVTESTIMKDVMMTERTIDQLKALGVQLEMDDFGAGYSSLNYLARFQFDSIKIDRLFISEMQDDPNQASLVRTIITMAHGLEMRVVAEGIETQAQMDQLLSYGCEYGQGYLFSRPRPAGEVERYLEGKRG